VAGPVPFVANDTALDKSGEIITIRDEIEDVIDAVKEPFTSSNRTPRSVGSKKTGSALERPEHACAAIDSVAQASPAVILRQFAWQRI
jgi:hypothetical protein